MILILSLKLLGISAINFARLEFQACHWAITIPTIHLLGQVMAVRA